MTLEDLHRTVVEGFSRIDERFARVEDRLAQNEARWVENAARFRELEETTRGHFEALAEHMQASVRIIAEGHAHLITIRDNHDSRLRAIEKRP